MISNDPRKPSIALVQPAPEPPGPKRTKPATTSGTFMGELLSPLYGLMNTRDARGTYAQKAIQHEQRRVRVDASATEDENDSTQAATHDIIYFKLRDTAVPLPLGWMLSAAAAKNMQQQLDLDDDVVQNKSALGEVLRSLPPAP